MRKMLLSILLAGAAASPALAQDSGDGGNRRFEVDDSARAERREAREQRQQARQEQPRAEQVEPARPQRPPPPVEQRQGFEQRQQSEPPQQQADREFDGRRGGFGERRLDGAQPQQPGEVRRFDRRRFEGQRNDQVQPARRDWDRAREGGWAGDLRQSDRRPPNVMRDRNPLIVSNTPREGTQPPQRAERRRHSGSNWNPSWRNDHRYDWRNWRDRHRSTFRIGIYYDPFGWGYRRYQVGWRLWPNYYGRSYWINDPWHYRLPYPPPGTVWVRYWDDALLVDTFTGEVIDVIHNFFW